MKFTHKYAVALAMVFSPVQIQFGQPVPAPGSSEAGLAYSVAERGAHHRVWERVSAEPNWLGEVYYQTNSFTELETGMHFWREGQWRETKAEITLLAEGAAATNGPHQVFFAANLNTVGAVTLLLPAGQALRSRILGLSYFDASTGQAVLIAETKDSIGMLVGVDQVVYTNAFDDLDGIVADVQYIYSKAGLEQNVVLRSQPPSPAEWGLNPETTRLQVLTEFYDPPVPQRRVATLEGTTELRDEVLDFSNMRISRGKAFCVGERTEMGRSVVISKQWAVLEGRTFLIEEVPFLKADQAIRGSLEKRQGASLNPRRRGKGENVLAALKPVLPQPVARGTAGRMQLAKLDLSAQPGFVLDYSIVNSATNFTFKGDTTYLLSGWVLLSGTTTLEGGSVIKSRATNNYVCLELLGPLVCQTSPYRPAVFTSSDDNSVGETISGSSGTPSIHATFYVIATGPGSGTVWDLKYVRMSYGFAGFVAYDGRDVLARHCQFVKNSYGVGAWTGDVILRDVLFSGCDIPIYANEDVSVEQATVDGYSTFCISDSGFSGLALTNCLVFGEGAWTGRFYGSGSLPDPILDHTISQASCAGVFQTAGAGSYYLATDDYRNAGTTNVNAELLDDLKERTTYPPLVVASNFTVATVLAPQAQRDTDQPDLGWHYDPLDWVVSGRTVSAPLTLTNGVALGAYGDSNGYGLSIIQYGKVLSGGSPTALNRVARYSTVQEQASTNWASSTFAPSVKLSSTSGVADFRFTEWSMLGGSGDHFYAQNTEGPLPSFNDCQFRSGRFYVYRCYVAVTNSLWERVVVYLKDNHHDNPWSFQNNLFFGGAFSTTQQGDGPWIVQDCLFDRTTASETANAGGFNAYVTNYSRVTYEATDVILTNAPAYRTSFLGRYYYPTNDGILDLLIDAGSRGADTAGLYHFTTTMNQVKETNSTVDMGFHFVAVDPSTGLPYDSDGDGVPDYKEDANGNGNGNDDPTSWQTYNSPNGLSSGNGLQVFTPLN